MGGGDEGNRRSNCCCWPVIVDLGGGRGITERERERGRGGGRSVCGFGSARERDLEGKRKERLRGCPSWPLFWETAANVDDLTKPLRAHTTDRTAQGI